jgi:hypothetical protein
MLRISLHTGLLEDRSVHNQIGVLDIAYQKHEAMADYLVGLTLRNVGEVAPNFLNNYPRWSASLWDLVARSLGRVLYQDDQIPAADKPDRRCAYATRMCAVIEGTTAAHRGRELGTVEILQTLGKRGTYTPTFTEDIMGPRVAPFDYGTKKLNMADLLLRAICHALYGQDTLSRRPKLILPSSAKIDGVDRFDIEALTEPARTGFRRFLAERFPTKEPQVLARSEDYVTFLMKS